MRHMRGLAAVLALCLLGPATAHADPNVLWTIVHDQCVVDEHQQHDPAPCSRVDLSRGESGGYAVLKDIVGDRQYLLIPTARITGIESPQVLDPATTNYFGAAWQARSFVEQKAGGTIARDWMSLAINSAVARTQNQLHIHIDCLRADVHEALRSSAGAIGPTWAPLAVPLVGHSYWAMAVGGADLDADPFTLLADGLEGARADMGSYTLVVVGTTDPAGRPGFVILADRADAETGAGGEELQDHDACPAPLPASGATAK
ncbi:CDP-diacylglycerol pyrophosphatase [Mycolicibacterium sp. BK556]|nr:CDP-diacylglycerol pyrophosphatase [Mycolicibacterium sp. BK556]MBB3634087.1 CDP-diacylglycerol pyrophosphatase [Mycolicibacterium sp. BK607]